MSNFNVFPIVALKAEKILLVLIQKSNYNESMKKMFGQILILASVLALADQTTKWVAVRHLETPVSLVGDIFMLEYTENTGMAFGLPMPYGILLFGSIFLLILIGFIAKKELDLRKLTARLAVALVMGGALGNIIDRIVNGYVIDFIKIWKWPNFNVADIFITAGILLIIIFYAKIRNDEQRRN